MRFCTNWQNYADDITIRLGGWLSSAYYSDLERTERFRAASRAEKAAQQTTEDVTHLHEMLQPADSAAVHEQEQIALYLNSLVSITEITGLAPAQMNEVNRAAVFHPDLVSWWSRSLVMQNVSNHEELMKDTNARQRIAEATRAVHGFLSTSK